MPDIFSFASHFIFISSFDSFLFFLSTRFSPIFFCLIPIFRLIEIASSPPDISAFFAPFSRSQRLSCASSFALLSFFRFHAALLFPEMQACRRSATRFSARAARLPSLLQKPILRLPARSP
jgi:hypothetical protein